MSPPIDIWLNPALWTAKQLKAAIDGARLLFAHVGPDGRIPYGSGMVEGLLLSELESLKEIGTVEKKTTHDGQDDLSDIANDALEVELEHLGVKDYQGNFWTSISAPLRLLVALGPVRNVAKLNYLRYFKPDSKKIRLVSVFPAPGTSGYGIPNYDYMANEPAFDREELDHVQAYVEQNPQQHPFVGGKVGFEAPEVTGAVNDDGEDWLSTPNINAYHQRKSANSVKRSDKSRFFGYLYGYRYGLEQVETKLKGLARSQQVQFRDSIWSPTGRKTTELLESTAKNVRVNNDCGRRNIQLGLSAVISGFGARRSGALSKAMRIELFRMLYDIAPFQSTLAYFGAPQMNNAIKIQQIFNLGRSDGNADLCDLLKKFLESQFIATCEALYVRNIREGALKEVTDAVKTDISTFLTSGYKLTYYMGPDDGRNFESLSIVDMACSPEGLSHQYQYLDQQAHLAMAASREPSTLDQTRAYSSHDDDNNGEEELCHQYPGRKSGDCRCCRRSQSEKQEEKW